ncbi:30S ribosomal protein S11 [Candidatus Pacearchaeota archaeon]|nr:30S ribosomal protein S11 [Candidatus Pacearchaeota archaeon]
MNKEKIVRSEEQVEKIKQEEIKKEQEEVQEIIPIKEEKQEEIIPGIAYVFGSYNNTIVHITDLSGSTIARISGGMVTKHSRLKSNPTTAMFVAKRACEIARDAGITALYIRMRGKTSSPGIGPGAHAAVKTLSKEGFKILGVLDTHRVPRGGPKKKGGKRGRRV